MAIICSFESRLRKLEVVHRPNGSVFFLAWGRDEAEAESIVARGSGKRHPEPRRYRGAGGMAGF